MKFLIILCIVLLPFSLGRFNPFSRKIRRHRNDILKTSSSNSLTNLNLAYSDEDLSKTQEEFDYYIYVRDVFPFGNDTDGKMQEKILQELNNILSNFKNTHKPVKLTTDGFSYLKPMMMTFDSDPERVVIFHNVTASRWYNVEYDQNTLLTFVRCDSSTKSKILVELPTSVQIVANLSIIGPNTNSGSEGLMKLVFKHGTTLSSDDGIFDEPSTKTSFANLKMYIQSNTASEILLDTNLQAFCNEIEFSLRQFLTNQLNEELAKRDAHLAETCPIVKFDQVQISEQNSSPVSVHNLNLFNNLYVISNIWTEIWKEMRIITLDAGQNIFSYFLTRNTCKLFVSREYDYNERRRYVKRLSSRMKIANFYGQLDSRFYYIELSHTKNSSMVTNSFVTDYVQLNSNYEFADT